MYICALVMTIIPAIISAGIHNTICNRESLRELSLKLNKLTESARIFIAMIFSCWTVIYHEKEGLTLTQIIILKQILLKTIRKIKTL